MATLLYIGAMIATILVALLAPIKDSTTVGPDGKTVTVKGKMGDRGECRVPFNGRCVVPCVPCVPCVHVCMCAVYVRVCACVVCRCVLLYVRC